MLMQLTYLFSPRMVQQLKWTRTVNVHGREGKNISADLHMEHKNRECKTIISGMGPNVTEQSIQRVARALKPLSSTILAFDHRNKVPSESDSHTRKSSSADMNKLVKQLFEDSKVFIKSPKQQTHKNFPHFSPRVMLKLDATKVIQWMAEHA